jgi:succinate dehydrogenase / fumarate reductase membrane anchor subunit
MKNKYRSDLSLAKNLGSAGSGSNHWWHQRFTAIIMVLLTFWFFCFFKELNAADLNGAIKIIQKPYNIIILTLFSLAGFYHSVLGMQVVIEDYITCRILRLSILLSVQIFSIVTVVSFLVAVLYVMNL